MLAIYIPGCGIKNQKAFPIKKISYRSAFVEYGYGIIVIAI
jgi:hypothetical protein